VTSSHNAVVKNTESIFTRVLSPDRRTNPVAITRCIVIVINTDGGHTLDEEFKMFHKIPVVKSVWADIKNCLKIF